MVVSRGLLVGNHMGALAHSYSDFFPVESPLIVTNKIDSPGKTVETFGHEGWRTGSDFDLKLYLLKP